MTIIASNRPGRFNLLYAFELIAVDSSGGAKNRVFGLAVNPSGYSVEETFATQVQPTSGGVHVAEAGILVRRVTVRGTFGLRIKRGWAAGTVEKPGGTAMVSRDGNELHDEFRSFLRVYARLKQKPDGVKWRLVWHDFVRGDHWIVVPESLSVDRDAGDTRLHLPYEVTFEAVADYDKASRGELINALDRALNTVNGAINAVNDITGFVEDVSSAVRYADAAVVGRVTAAIAAANFLISSAADLVAGVSGIMNINRRIAATVAQTVGALVELTDGRAGGWSPGDDDASGRLFLHASASGLADAVDALRANDAVWGEDLGAKADRRAARVAGEASASPAAVAQASLAAERTAGTASREAGAAARAAREPGRQTFTGRRAYVIRPNDTILGIASREAGGPDAVADLVNANALRAPYISRARLPGTLGPGDTLWIPVVTTDRTGTTTAGEDDPDDDILGVDLALNPAGDLLCKPDGTDVEMVRGVPAYLQSLEHVVFGAPLGRNLVYPHVGMASPIGEGNRGNRVRELELAARAAALSDSRTASVERVNADDGGDHITLNVWVVPIGRDSSRVVRKRVA